MGAVNSNRRLYKVLWNSTEQQSIEIIEITYFVKHRRKQLGTAPKSCTLSPTLGVASAPTLNRNWLLHCTQSLTVGFLHNVYQGGDPLEPPFPLRGAQFELNLMYIKGETPLDPPFPYGKLNLNSIQRSRSSLLQDSQGSSVQTSGGSSVQGSGGSSVQGSRGSSVYVQI